MSASPRSFPILAVRDRPGLTIGAYALCRRLDDIGGVALVTHEEVAVPQHSSFNLFRQFFIVEPYERPAACCQHANSVP